MISKLRVLLWIGIGLLFLPYFGFPDAWRTVITICLGIVIIILVFKLRREYKILKFQIRRYEEPAVEPIIHE